MAGDTREDEGRNSPPTHALAVARGNADMDCSRDWRRVAAGTQYGQILFLEMR